MTRAHFVKKARKDNPVVKAGSSYWWWKFAYRRKQYSATRPRSSQLTQSRWGEVLVIEEDFDDSIARASSTEDLEGAAQEAVDQLRAIADEFQESIYNMPEQLQDSETANQIQERVDNLNNAADTMEALDWIEPEDAKEECDDDETPIEAAFRLNQTMCESEIEWPYDPF